MADAERCCALFEAAMKKRGLLLHKVGHGWTGEVLGCETVGSWNPASGGISPDKRPLAAQIQGKRDFYMGIPANTNLCLSNPDTVNAFAELVVSYARRNPSVDYLHVWLADDYNNVCECAQCRQTTVSDQYVSLLNEIDRRLTEEKLNTRLVFLLYQELLWPPLKSRLNHPDRFVLMFAPISRTFEASYTLTGEKAAIPAFDRNHITLPTSLSQNLAFLRGWQAQFRGESFVYDYPLGRAHYGDFGYVGISRIIHQDIRKLRQMGLDGYISCVYTTSPDYPSPRGLRVGDPEANAAETMNALWGSFEYELQDGAICRMGFFSYYDAGGPGEAFTVRPADSRPGN